VPREALEMSGKLDHILTKGFDFVEGKVMDDEKMVGKDYHPSDHHPLYVVLTYTI
jgi:hypothetical protein